MKTDIDLDARIIGYGHPMHMCMFTDEANFAVFNAISSLIYRGISGGFRRRDLRKMIDETLKFIEKIGYGECFDTEVRGAVAARINKELCLPMGWIQIDGFFDDIE